MSVEAMMVDDKTREILGREGLEELALSMWAVDCQTCGGYLGEETPVLYVDDSYQWAHATLHHQSCRTPAWNDTSVHWNSPGDHISFITVLLMLPVTDGRDKHLVPMMLINPGLEHVILERDEKESWHVRPPAFFRAAGLCPLGSGGTSIGKPIEGVTAFISSASIAVVFSDMLQTTYEAPADEEFVSAARGSGGLLVGVTHALHPGEITRDTLLGAMASGKILAGWVGAHGQAPEQPGEHPDLGITCILHWDDRGMSVGKLVASAPSRLNAKKATAWAARVIGKEIGKDARLIPWQVIDDEKPGEGWRVMDAISARNFILRRYPDGWKLVETFSQVRGSSVETDNEARAWAGEVLRFKKGVTSLTWVPGPSTPGSSTLYADA